MGSHHHGPKAEVAALDAYIKLMRAAESVTARAHLVLPDGVTITQFAALEALYHRGPLIQSELAAKLLRSGGNLTLVVVNLERDGLITRERTAADRRFVKVALTPKVVSGSVSGKIVDPNGRGRLLFLSPLAQRSPAAGFAIAAPGPMTKLTCTERNSEPTAT